MYTSGIKQVNISLNEQKYLSPSFCSAAQPHFFHTANSILRRKKVADLIRGQLEETSSVPFMITRSMKTELGSLGHSEEDIRNMTPGDAHILLAAGREEKE